MDPKLKTFLKLCEEMNYRKTAEEMNLTQPAVTQQIHLLEREYGCRLFQYDRRKLSATKEAAILRGYAQNLLYQEGRVREKILRQNGRRLRMGATKTIAQTVIAGQVAGFAQADGNEIAVETDNTGRLLSRVLAGELDFALIEGFFDRRLFACRLYRAEPFVGICRKSHPFAAKVIPLDAVWGEHLLVREEGSGTRDIFEQMLREHNHHVQEFRRLTTIGSVGLLLDVLERVGGITFAYEAALTGRSGLQKFTLRGMETTREFNYVFLDNAYARELVEHFDSFRAAGKAPRA